MNNQAYTFIIFIINGIIIGFLFDCFRIIRKSFKTELAHLRTSNIINSRKRHKDTVSKLKQYLSSCSNTF